MSQISFQVLIEEDKTQGDFVAYIPAIRLGARGDSLEEVRENAKDLLQMEIESRMRKGKELPADNSSFMDSLTIAMPIIA